MSSVAAVPAAVDVENAAIAAVAGVASADAHYMLEDAARNGPLLAFRPNLAKVIASNFDYGRLRFRRLDRLVSVSQSNPVSSYVTRISRLLVADALWCV